MWSSQVQVLYMCICQATGVSSGAVPTPWICAWLEGTNESVLVQVFGPGPGLCLALVQLSVRFAPPQAGVGFIKLVFHAGISSI